MLAEVGDMTTDSLPLRPIVNHAGDSLPREWSVGSDPAATTPAKQALGARQSNKLQLRSEGIEVQIAEETPRGDVTPEIPGSQFPSFGNDDCDNEEPEYQGDVEWLTLEQNVWDLALLVGLRHPHGCVMGFWRSLLSVSLLAMNIAIQFGFVLAISSSMASDALSEATWGGVAKDRYENHNVAMSDPMTLKSRAAMICSTDVFSTTTDLRSAVGTYLQTINTKGFLGVRGMPGEVVASLAVLIWFLSMVTEIRRVCDVGSAVLSVPLAHSSQLPVDEDRHTVHRLGAVHKIVVCGLILLPRLLTDVLLLQFGASWLAATFNVSDIIVNACALEIVRNVDELLFTALLGRRTKKAIELVRFKWHSIAKGHERLLIVARVALVSICCGVIYQRVIVKRRERVEAFENLLCGGETNFLYRGHPVTQMPLFSNDDSVAHSARTAMKCIGQAMYASVVIRMGFEPEYVGLGRKVTNETIRQMIRGTHELCRNADTPGVQICPLVSVDELFDDELFNSSCQDYPTDLAVVHDMCKDDEYGRVVFDHVRTCDDLLPLCHQTEVEGPSSRGLLHFAKLLCGKTCGICDKNRKLKDQEARSSEEDGASAASRRTSLDNSEPRLLDIRFDEHQVMGDLRWRLKWPEGRSRIFRWRSPTLTGTSLGWQHRNEFNEAPKTHVDNRHLDDKVELQMEQLRQSIQELQRDKRELEQRIDSKDKLVFFAVFASMVTALVSLYVALPGATSLRSDRA